MRTVKKNFLAAGVFAGVLLTGCIAVFMAKTPPQGVKKTTRYDAIAGYLQDGDVICRLGDRLWSLYFKETSPLDKRFSHLGIVHITPGAITVINAEGLALQGKDLVNEVALDDFLSTARSIGIYRLKNHGGELLSRSAAEYKGRSFDWSFDLENDDKLYCTELLYAALKNTAPEIQLETVFIKELGRKIVPLEACSNSEYFKEVVYFNP
ncbi:MAG: hypothetical protein LBO65_08335 [Spirochaetaceae bacterium]|jgi:hypothetical protein|nr:hypothetical protein [Spirochaetaceae bacterium]